MRTVAWALAPRANDDGLMAAESAHARRRTERRGTERRRPAKREPEDSWFGALANAGESSRRDDSLAESERYQGDAPGVSDSRFLAREASRIVSGDGTALHRVFRAYVAARAALGAALVLAPWAMSLMGVRPPLSLLLVCLIYATQAVSLWLLGGSAVRSVAPAERLRRRQWLLTIGVDLLAFSALHLMEVSQPLNYTALLALPVLMAGVMSKRLPALATAAFVTLVLLAGVWRPALQGADAVLLFSQAGLAGIGAFVITLLSGELAQRLAREERTARGSLEIARQQAQLNRLVLEEMADGVMVIDRRLRVRSANRAARLMMGVALARGPLPLGLQSEPEWKALFDAVEQSFALGHWPDTLRELRLGGAGAAPRLLQVRARFTTRDGIEGAGEQAEVVCVLFLEDMRHVQARVRQEKLAAMGRMSAGISHEIRNPLAAIAQANALLLEDVVDPTQRRLANIVEANVQRLKRIVDDVLAVATSSVGRATPVDAIAQVRQVCDEWAQTADVGNPVAVAPGGAARRVILRLPSSAQRVLFDDDHLRRVLVNLLDNAGRHATQAEGAIAVELAQDDAPGGLALSVASDGPPIAPDVERHLFEPFFSTRSRGSGLGLYICRELCERYGASIEYRPRPGAERLRNEFVVVMRRHRAAAPMPIESPGIAR